MTITVFDVGITTIHEQTLKKDAVARIQRSQVDWCASLSIHSIGISVLSSFEEGEGFCCSVSKVVSHTPTQKTRREQQEGKDKEESDLFFFSFLRMMTDLCEEEADPEVL